MKNIIITGIAGQDGYYLTKFLLQKDYFVHGIVRNKSDHNQLMVNKIITDNIKYKNKIAFHYCDITDYDSLLKIFEKIKPEEIYNLAAQSSVSVSFINPIDTTLSNAIGVINILEIIRSNNMQKFTKFYQASSSELFGKSKIFPQDEKTPFNPSSPYAISKLYSHLMTINYRESYSLFACNGISFNHESPLRNENFVTKKITVGLIKIFLGMKDCLYLGNLESKRDWGHASDYVKIMWLILQQSKPDDYILATGTNHSVKEFVTKTSQVLGMDIIWEGKGVDQIGIYKNKIIIKVDKNFYRPLEPVQLIGNPSKALKKLKWKPEFTFDKIIEEMVKSDLKEIQK